MAIPSQYEWITNINHIYLNGEDLLVDSPSIVKSSSHDPDYHINLPFSELTLTSPDYTSGNNHLVTGVVPTSDGLKIFCISPMTRIDVDTSVSPIVVTYTNTTNISFAHNDWESYVYSMNFKQYDGAYWWGWLYYHQAQFVQTYLQSSFSTLQYALEYIYQHYANIILYVDGEKWVDPTPITYTWQSVPSISGKNGILNLTQIKEEYIEGGEPTSSAEATCFDNLLRSNRVATLIDAALPEPEVGGTTVTVHYVIEAASSGSYTYCKLVAKRNKIPNSIEDGDKVIDINPAQNKVTVKNLRALTKYYFVIFVKDSNNIEGISDPESITTGQNRNIILFTDEFNEDILVDNWNITVYESGWGNGSSLWNPSTFHNDFLTAYNFLIGNASRRSVWPEDGEIIAPNATAMTDGTFWIPIKRSTVPEAFKIEFDAKVDPQGYAEADYNYAWVAVGCVDSDNNWHQCDYKGGVPGRDWVHYEAEITGWTYGYIDYIGLSYCDGKPHFKNVKITV